MSTVESSTREEELVRVRLEQLLGEGDPRHRDPALFLGRQFDLGLAWVHFPFGHGGLGVSPGLQEGISERLAAAGAPTMRERNVIGHGMAAPTIVTHGSDDQKRRYLRPLFTGEEIWCQMFSEPGAGSDVASLSTRAVRDGNFWIINGQKVWITLGHRARWGLLLARTDPEQPKHEGLTYFVVDMRAQGVEVRPLRQMTGEAEFNEVYFTDARIPDAERLGEVGEGWRVAITTLMNERVAAAKILPRAAGPISDAIRIWKQRGHTDPALRDRLMVLWIRAEVDRLTNIRASQSRELGTPGPEGSVGKLVFGELNEDIFEMCLNLLGADGLLYSSYEMRQPETTSEADSVQKAFLRARANSIEGGTSEVMRNILGERVLGLPADIRTDKGLPWSHVPRS